MKFLCEDILIIILELCEVKDVINYCLINKKIHKFFINNKNYIGFKKLKLLFNNIFNKEKFNYFDIYYKIINYKILNYNDLIYESSLKGHLEVIKFININNIYNKINYAFIVAAYNGNLDIINYFIHEFNYIDIIDINFALIYSSGRCDLEIIKFLINNGADIHYNNEYALEVNIKNNRIDIVKYLLDLYKNIDNLLINLLVKLSSDNSHLEIFKFLINKFKLYSNYSIFKISLFYHIEKRNFNFIEYLTHNYINNYEINDLALKYSIKNNHYDIIKYIINESVYIYTLNNFYFKYIIEKSPVKITKFLIENGIKAPPNFICGELKNRSEKFKKYLIHKKIINPLITNNSLTELVRIHKKY